MIAIPEPTPDPIDGRIGIGDLLAHIEAQSETCLVLQSHSPRTGVRVPVNAHSPGSYGGRQHLADRCPNSVGFSRIIPHRSVTHHESVSRNERGSADWAATVDAMIGLRFGSLVERCRCGRLAPDEWKESVFTRNAFELSDPRFTELERTDALSQIDDQR